ncbi:Hypothetical predicted protein [Pelobates cultripes]|uniref:Uncharacterized protein n=1 Tax=Pelobates cultripes TaxID=61616 RepID=A0AAD1T1H7_PELCU|nr:Hypothetical predicted protein [Pelobates cultripes]
MSNITQWNFIWFPSSPVRPIGSLEEEGSPPDLRAPLVAPIDTPVGPLAPIVESVYHEKSKPNSGFQYWEEYKLWAPSKQLVITQQLPDVEKAPLALVLSLSTIQATYQCTWMDLKQIVALKAGPFGLEQLLNILMHMRIASEERSGKVKRRLKAYPSTTITGLEYILDGVYGQGEADLLPTYNTTPTNMGIHNTASDNHYSAVEASWELYEPGHQLLVQGSKLMEQQHIPHQKRPLAARGSDIKSP